MAAAVRVEVPRRRTVPTAGDRNLEYKSPAFVPTAPAQSGDRTEDQAPQESAVPHEQGSFVKGLFRCAVLEEFLLTCLEIYLFNL